MATITELQAIIQPAVEAVGLELWGVEYLAQGKHSVLRVFIDQPGPSAGINLDDCERASQQISALLDVEDPIAGEYTLEVSSPGIDRPLFYIEQYQRYLGQEVAVRLHTALNGKRKWQGTLQAVRDNTIQFKVDEEIIDIALDDIAKANLVADIHIGEKNDK